MADLKEIIFRYGFVAGKRFYKNEKMRFLRGATKEFYDLKMPVDVKVATHSQREAYNLYAGDFDSTDIVLSTYFDTPPKTFGFAKHRPFEIENDRKSFRIAMLVPMIFVLLVGALVLFWGYKFFGSDGIFDFKDVLVMLLALLLVFFLFRFRNGVGNRVNLVRNTSSIVCLIQLANMLSNKERNKFAVAFTDFGCANHFGDIMLKDLLGVDADKKTVIFLDCVGADQGVNILYHKSCRHIVEKWIKICDDKDYAFSFKEIPDKGGKHYNHFGKSIYILGGELVGESVSVDNVNNRRDSKLNENNVQNVAEFLKSIYSL